MKIVFSYGGSILAPKEYDEKFIKKVSEVLIELSKNHEIAVVVGGGVPARVEIEKAKEQGISSSAQLDFVGIKQTRKNAEKLIDNLGLNAYSEIPESIMQAGELFGHKILVMGGTEPGHSTDAVAALLADWISADLIVNASNIEYIYDSDPTKNPNAKPLKEITAKELVDMVVHLSTGAGEYALIDLMAAKIIQRTGIKTIVLDGRKLDNISDAIAGLEFNGTIIK